MPLIVLHAAADFTSVLSLRPLGDLVIAATALGFVALGFVTLGRRIGRPQPRVSRAPS